MNEERRLNHYSAYFDGYYFRNNVNRILLKEIRGKNFYMKDGFIDANKVPYLIGNLIMDYPLNFCSIEPLIEREIKRPIMIKFKKDYKTMNNIKQTNNWLDYYYYAPLERNQRA